MSAVKAHQELELQLIIGASALLYRFGDVAKLIQEDGFESSAVVHSIVEGETPTTMAKSTGLAIVELATHFENLKPDVVLTVADRFETLATAVAASYMNIPLAHTQGGEVTGSIDESVRHAITKLAHIHFPATKRASDYLVRMGEDPNTIHLTGCPAIDLLTQIDLRLPTDIFKKYGGVGASLDSIKPYIVVLQHPVTTEYGEGFAQINQTLNAISRIGKEGMQIVWLWPNVDAGSDDISKGLRMFREKNKPTYMSFFRNFSPEDYARVINNAQCLVGNSSSGLREGAFLGVPCVNIGSRQRGRERAENVLDVNYDCEQIYQAIKTQLTHSRYGQSFLVGDGSAGKRIVDILAKVDISINKSLNYLLDH
jgi:UDP-hydrolysing UDP-N-acetyl-D-glucosamine 2-epimerase